MMRNVGDTRFCDMLDKLSQDEYISVINILKETKGESYSIIKFGNEYYEYDDIRTLQHLTFTKEDDGKCYLADILIHLMQIGILNNKDVDGRELTREALSSIPFDILLNMSDGWGIKFEIVCGSAYVLMGVECTYNPTITPFKYDDIIIPIKFKQTDTAYSVSGCWSEIATSLASILRTAVKEKTLDIMERASAYTEATIKTEGKGLLRYIKPHDVRNKASCIRDRGVAQWDFYKDTFCEICVNACRQYIENDKHPNTVAFDTSMRYISELIFKEYGLNAKISIDNKFMYKDEGVLGNDKAIQVILKPDEKTSKYELSPYSVYENKLTENLLPPDLCSHHIQSKNHYDMLLESITFIGDAYGWEKSSIKTLTDVVVQELKRRIFEKHPKLHKDNTFSKWLQGDPRATETSELSILLGDLFGVHMVKWTDTGNNTYSITFQLSNKYIVTLRKTLSGRHEVLKHYITTERREL